MFQASSRKDHKRKDFFCNIVTNESKQKGYIRDNKTLSLISDAKYGYNLDEEGFGMQWGYM